MCELAREALQHPTYLNIGVIIAAEFDPLCRSMSWVPLPGHGWAM